MKIKRREGEREKRREDGNEPLFLILPTCSRIERKRGIESSQYRESVGIDGRRLT